jgi:hypothetical protein
LKRQYVIPPEASAAFVANVEDVLDGYHRPHDPDRPMVCLDETSKESIATNEPNGSQGRCHLLSSLRKRDDGSTHVTA